MALPASGAISLSAVNTELGLSATAVSYTYSTNTTDASLNIAALGGYASGRTDVTVTVNSGIYVYATSNTVDLLHIML